MIKKYGISEMMEEAEPILLKLEIAVQNYIEANTELESILEVCEVSIDRLVIIQQFKNNKIASRTITKLNELRKILNH